MEISFYKYYVQAGHVYPAGRIESITYNAKFMKKTTLDRGLLPKRDCTNHVTVMRKVRFFVKGKKIL